jgi:hypothetical protein
MLELINDNGYFVEAIHVLPFQMPNMSTHFNKLFPNMDVTDVLLAFDTSFKRHKHLIGRIQSVKHEVSEISLNTEQLPRDGTHLFLALFEKFDKILHMEDLIDERLNKTAEELQQSLRVLHLKLYFEKWCLKFLRGWLQTFVDSVTEKQELTALEGLFEM